MQYCEAFSFHSSCSHLCSGHGGYSNGHRGSEKNNSRFKANNKIHAPSRASTALVAQRKEISWLRCYDQTVVVWSAVFFSCMCWLPFALASLWYIQFATASLGKWSFLQARVWHYTRNECWLETVISDLGLGAVVEFTWSGHLGSLHHYHKPGHASETEACKRSRGKAIPRISCNI